MLFETPQTFQLTLNAASGVEFSIDCLGVPSLVPVSSSEVGDLASILDLAVSYPNPFNPSTTIHFDLPREVRVELAIYDVKGRLVKTLFQGSLPAGGHDEVWLGRDDQGREVPSGVYVCRLQAGDRIYSTKMTLQK